MRGRNRGTMGDRHRATGGRATLVARLVLRRVAEPHRSVVTGDLLEEYAESILPERGRFAAGAWLIGQAVRTAMAFALQRRAAHSSRTGPVGDVARFDDLRLVWLPDMRGAIRTLVRQPGFSLLAVATLAIGVGAATAVFGILDWALLRSAPGISDPDRVVSVAFRADGPAINVSFPDLRDVAAASPGLAAVAGHTNLPIQVGADAVRAVEVMGELVTGEYFKLLGVGAEIGRLLAPGDDATPGVVVSHRFWNRHLGGGLGVVGSTLRLNGVLFTVVGVADREFRGAGRVSSVDLWVPLERYGELRRVPAQLGWNLDNRSAAIVRGTAGRLVPGATAEAVQAQLRAATVRLVEEHGDEASIPDSYLPVVTRGAGLDPDRQAEVTESAPAFAGAAAMVLLIACANVAGLLLLRGARRRGEFALRRALGAGRWSLCAQHLADTVVLTVPAVALGLVFARWMGRVVWDVGLVPSLWATGYWNSGTPPQMTIDPRVAAFAAAVTFVATLGAGALPALAAGRTRAPRGSHGTVRSVEGTLGRALIVVQLALSLALLTGTVLLERSLHNLRGVELGFAATHLSTWSIDPGPQGYALEDAWSFHREVARRVTSAGAEATLAAYGPLNGVVGVVGISPSVGEIEPLIAYADWVAPDYLDAMRMPLRRGRGFTERDGDAVAVLSERIARRLFGADSSVGQTVRVRAPQGESVRRVVGEVSDLAGWSRRAASPGAVYLPLDSAPVARATLLVRSAMPLAQLDRSVADAVAEVDPAIPAPRIEPMDELVERSLSHDLGLARLMRLLALLATVLVAVGLYSMVSWVGRGRLREFGVRIALGARPGAVAQLVLRPALIMGAVGTSLGLLFSLGVARVVASRLFGVSALDPVSFVVAALGLALVVVAAAIEPAVRATRTDPVKVLRAE